MMYQEIQFYDIRHNPAKVNEILTDNVHCLSNQLYVLTEGNHLAFDETTMKALASLEKYLKKILDNPTKV